MFCLFSPQIFSLNNKQQQQQQKINPCIPHIHDMRAFLNDFPYFKSFFFHVKKKRRRKDFVCQQQQQSGHLFNDIKVNVSALSKCI